jgi:hypothetical protein
MSYRQVSRVLYGFRVEIQIDRWDEKWLPHIEGHQGTDILMLSSEEDPNVWYCGIVLASSDDGICKDFSESVKSEHIDSLIEFQVKIFGRTEDFRPLPRRLFLLTLQV